MALFSAFFKCFVPSSLSQVSDDVIKADSSEKPKNKSKSSGAPIVVSYFPVNSNLSRL
ncbi:protein QUIRKY-like [Fagus crenata]